MNDVKKDDKKTVTEMRRPYTKPGVVTAEVFETMALSCASVGINCVGPDKS